MAQRDVLRLVKPRKKAVGVKPINIYARTHARLQEASDASGISMTRLVTMCVDFALDRVVIEDGDVEEEDA